MSATKSIQQKCITIEKCATKHVSSSKMYAKKKNGYEKKVYI